MSPVFLVCGYPKSGTTFLQRLLNLHPQISCPSEQEFRVLRLVARRALTDYAQVLQIMDRRTGGQGVPTYPPTIEDEMVVAMARTFSAAFAQGKPIHGLNDNTVFMDLSVYRALFPGTKFIGIIRNPVDVGLSLWTHMHRLARDEPDMAAAHLSVVENSKGTVEGYIERGWRTYRSAVDTFLNLASIFPGILVVRYERLVVDKTAELKRILEFLSADMSPDVVSTMVANSSKEAMAARSANPGFFGLDKNDSSRATVSREFRQSILTAAISPLMREQGYDIATLMAQADAASEARR